MTDEDFDYTENSAENLQRLTVLGFGKFFSTLQQAGIIYQMRIPLPDEEMARLAEDLMKGVTLLNDLLDAMEKTEEIESDA